MADLRPAGVGESGVYPAIQGGRLAGADTGISNEELAMLLGMFDALSDEPGAEGSKRGEKRDGNGH